MVNKLKELIRAGVEIKPVLTARDGEWYWYVYKRYQYFTGSYLDAVDVAYRQLQDIEFELDRRDEYY